MGRLVLSLARWNLVREEARRLGAARPEDRLRAVRTLRCERRIPRLVLLADGDNTLLLDLEASLCVDAFVHLVKDRESALLTEFFPGPDLLCARGPEGRFVHELVVPFLRVGDAARDASEAPVSSSAVEAPVARSFPPASEWLHAKLYCGPSVADEILRSLASTVREAIETGAVDRWFFVRYSDPEFHLRLRLHGSAEGLWSRVLPAFSAMVSKLTGDGKVIKLQLETYERELERYGGLEAIELAERIFQADSEAVLQILEMLEEEDEAQGERWRMALLGMDALLGDLGLGMPEKRRAVARLRGAFGAEFREDSELRRGLGEKYRKEKGELIPLLELENHQDNPLWPGHEVLLERSARVAPLVEQLRALEERGLLRVPVAKLAESFAHMHVNRLLRGSHRKHELVLYDFLGRMYQAHEALRTSRT
jgi:thiopeptide-type bacteriocin biosynthesis protein